MYQEEYLAMTAAAQNKLRLCKNRPGVYLIASMLAGAFVGFGVFLAFTIGGYAGDAPFAKAVMGASFSVALSLIVFAGGELFTGNNMVLASGFLRHKVSGGDVLRVWGLCWIGNLMGSVMVAFLFVGAGLASGQVGQFMADAAATKMTLDPLPLLFRGILCNFLVCLAVWCTFRCKSESGKLIMIFLCILVFFTCGFEHSVANMTLLTVGLLVQTLNEAITFGGYFYNLLLVSCGNILAGVFFMALPYHLLAGKQEAK